MITSASTPADFQKWEEHAATLDVDALQYVIRDCIDASIAMRGWNPEREGYYSDQASVYSSELRRRKND